MLPYICINVKEVICTANVKPYKDEKFKTSPFLCCCCSIDCYYTFINANTLQIMKNYFSKQKPQILTVAIVAAYFLINLIFR